MNNDAKSISAYLVELINACELVVKYTKDMDQATLEQDDAIEGMVFYRIILIGEAARRLPQNFKDGYPDIPWLKIVGMRN